MDYLIRFIGIVFIVTKGSTTNVNNYTAFLPKWQSGLSFCSGTIHSIGKHEAFIRVPTPSIKTGTNWAEKDTCKNLSMGPDQDCTVFFIPKTSAITINSGFTPKPPTHTEGSAFGVLHRLGVADPTIQLLADPFKASAAWLVLPDGEINAEELANKMISTKVRVVAPVGTTPTTMTIEAVPRGGGKKRTLVVAAGTEIILGVLPRAHSGMSINAVNPNPGNKNHFFLVNTLLPVGHHFCAAPDLDALCSNQGCCP